MRVYTNEATEQTWLFEWLAQMARLKYPELALAHHIPNGGSRNAIEAARLKAQGVKAGIPDICIPVARKGFHGLYIELKRQRNGRLSDAQKDMILRLRQEGYKVEVCKGFQEAANVIEEYMRETER